VTAPLRPDEARALPFSWIRRLLGGLRSRVILTYLIIFLVSTVIIVGRTGSIFAQMALDTAQHDLRAQTYVIASALARPLMRGADGRGLTLQDLQALAQRLSPEGGPGQLLIYNSQGQLVATSASGAVAPSAGRQMPPEVVNALRGQIASALRRDPQTGQQMLYSAAPLGEEDHTWGAVQIAIPASEELDRIRSFWLSMGLTALLAALVAILAGWLLAGQLVRPVDRLRDAASALAAGNLDERVPPKDTGGVTEIVQLADAFNNMAGRIQDMLVRQRQFVADASHELRTPLTNIKLRAEALGAGALDDPTVAQRFVGEIESEANRLSRMAGDLLTLSRQDSSAPAFRERMELGDLAGQVVEEMALRAERGGVTLSAEIEPDLPTIVADPVGLHTVLVNLVDNALQYTPSGGRVTVCAGRDGLESLFLKVSDTGAGIPPDDLPHVFDRFYRIDKARSRRLAQRAGSDPHHTGSGAGLGLAIVRGIVEEHGGTVSAESTIGEGTTMTVVLPLKVEG
jgi:signal transduction histidine kinase